MKKILIISIFILFLAGCSFGNKKVENQEIQQKSGDTSVEIENSITDLSYNQVLNSKREPSDTPGYDNSEYNGKVVKWRAKISANHTQITGIKFCVVDSEHQNVDIKKPCDFFWAFSGDLMDADNMAINPSWDGQWVPYILNYYKVPFDKNENYYDEIYIITGKINSLDSAPSENDKYIPDVDIINIAKDENYQNTEVIQYAPPEILPKKILDGYCWTSSLATNRTDAWRCMNDHSMLDPCFNLTKSKKVICPNNPADENDDLVLNLTKSLPKPDPQLNEFQSEEYVWYIELQNGSYCLPIIGASAFVGNDRANFLCESEEYIMGKLNAGLVWTAKKAILSPVDQQSGDFTIKSSEEVSIKKVWE